MPIPAPNFDVILHSDHGQKVGIAHKLPDSTTFNAIDRANIKMLVVGCTGIGEPGQSVTGRPGLRTADIVICDADQQALEGVKRAVSAMISGTSELGAFLTGAMEKMRQGKVRQGMIGGNVC